MSKLLEKLGYGYIEVIKNTVTKFGNDETEIDLVSNGGQIAFDVIDGKTAGLLASAPEMLEALIDTLVDVEFYYDLSVGGKPPFAEAYSEALSILQKALGMTWIEIKEQIDVCTTD